VLLNAEKKGVSILLKFVELSEERNLYCTVLVVSKLRIPEGIFCSVLFCSALLCPVLSSQLLTISAMYYSILCCSAKCFVVRVILFSVLSIDRYGEYWN
jgi:hypothetical protein